MRTLKLLVKTYEIIEDEDFAQEDGLYQNKKVRALFILTKKIIDWVLKQEVPNES